METVRFAAFALCMAAGLFGIMTGVFGVNKFRYVLNRMHAAAMGDTLGILFILLGLLIAGGAALEWFKFLVVILILWLASPVSSHLIARLEVTTNDRLELPRIEMGKDKTEDQNGDL